MTHAESTAIDAPDIHQWNRIIRGADLGMAAQAVAWRLMSYANTDGTKAHPGVERLVADTRSSDKTVRRALQQLEEAGWIRCVKRGQKNAGASEYRLTVPQEQAHLIAQKAQSAQKASQDIRVSSFEALRAHGDAVTASRLIGIPYLPIPQRPSDTTPHVTYDRAQAVRFVTEHETEIRAAFAQKRSLGEKWSRDNLRPSRPYNPYPKRDAKTGALLDW